MIADPDETLRAKTAGIYLGLSVVTLTNKQDLEEKVCVARYNAKLSGD
ncbi:hypothetical protein AB4376_11570 [Vibrio breoganii]